MKRTLTKVILAALAWSLASSASAQIVVVVRHAEKADESRDPVLSEAGTQRATALVESFGAEGPDLVLTSPLQRTGLTAAPSVAAFGAPVRAVSLTDGVDAHIAGIVAEIAAMPRESVVLVVGHSNTVPLIVRALGLESADMPDCEYDRRTLVDLNAFVPRVDVTRYGARSSC
jgi:broad specificity phosphatase PhoE